AARNPPRSFLQEHPRDREAKLPWRPHPREGAAREFAPCPCFVDLASRTLIREVGFGESRTASMPGAGRRGERCSRPPAGLGGFDGVPDREDEGVDLGAWDNAHSVALASSPRPSGYSTTGTP